MCHFSILLFFSKIMWLYSDLHLVLDKYPSIDCDKRLLLKIGQNWVLKQNTDRLNKLNDKLIVNVLRFLSFKDMLVSSTVCRRFYRLSKTNILWRTVDMSHRMITENTLHKLVDLGIENLHLAFLQALFVTFETSTPIETIVVVGHQSNLRYLTLSNVLRQESVRRLLGRCRVLQGLSLTGCAVDDETCRQIALNKNMQILSLRNCRISQLGVVGVLNGCRRLVELNLRLSSGIVTITQSACAYLSTTLRKLDIWGSCLMQETALGKLIERCTELTELHIYPFYQMTISALEKVFFRLPNLKIFSCSRWNRVCLDCYFVHYDWLKSRVTISGLSTDDADYLKSRLPAIRFVWHQRFAVAEPTKFWCYTINADANNRTLRTD